MMKKQVINQDEIASIECNLSYGLNTEQINQRVNEGLVNKMPKAVTKSYGRILFDNLFNFFNIILFAVAIFLLCAGATASNFVFAYLLLVNIAIGLFQDIKARRQADKLKVVSYPTVKVIRNGAESTIPVNKLVLSDIVILKNGDQIVSDAVLLDGDLEVNESLLTGESLNIVKKVNDVVYSGSYVTSGYAKVRVIHVGRGNYAVSLQNKARKFKRPKSEILAALHKIFTVIGVIVVVLGTAMLATYIATGAFDGDKFKESALSFGGSIVAMVPIGMYLLVTLTLAVGVIRLAKRRTLVQELYSIETLARVDTLCLDKTGTITDGTMSVNKVECLGSYQQNDINDILFTLVNATKDENSTAKAILKGFENSNSLSFNGALPFSSSRKYSAVMLKDGRCFVLGAKEFLSYKDKAINEKCLDYEKQGLRVLLLGFSKKGLNNNDVKPKIEPAAILVLEDHIKDDAKETIAWFKENDVAIKIISGDSPISVSEIAKKVGVEGADKYISLEAMPLDEVKQIATKFNVFGRVSPEQKEVLVRALQEAKHVVAMTGDGVNDILALRVADCSIAMANGSDAAKAASHLVSMDSNFSSLPAVVREGRRVINNLQRSISVFLVKTLFAMIITTVFLISLWAGGIKYPFVPNNLYIWELLGIGFTCFFLSLQPNNEKVGTNSFLKNILDKSLPGGLIQTIFTLIYFAIAMVCDLTGNAGMFSYELATTMSIITFSVLAFVTLLIVSWPYDIYRKVLCTCIGVLIVGFFLIDYFVYVPRVEKSFFLINYDLITTSNWWILVLNIAVAIPVYLLINYYIVKKYGNLKKENK